MGHKFETKKMITNCNYGKPITILEVSVYHNILITGSENSTLYVWDYEFSRLISSLQIVRGFYYLNKSFFKQGIRCFTNLSNIYKWIRIAYYRWEQRNDLYGSI